MDESITNTLALCAGCDVAVAQSVESSYETGWLKRGWCDMCGVYAGRLTLFRVPGAFASRFFSKASA